MTTERAGVFNKSTDLTLSDYAWESNLLDWAHTRPEVWSRIPSLSRKIVDLNSRFPLRETALNRRLAKVSGIPPAEIIRLKTGTITLLAQAKGEEEETAGLYQPATDWDIQQIIDSGTVNDPTSMYLLKISRYPFYHHAQQKRAFTAWEMAKRVEELKKDPTLLASISEEEWGQLQFKGSIKGLLSDKQFAAYIDPADQKKYDNASADSQTIPQFISLGFLRLVVSQAKYWQRFLPLLDCCQAGNIGLLNAIDKFDRHRGFKFITYATWAIRHAISLEVADQSRNIRLPRSVTSLLPKIRRTIADLEQETERTINYPLSHNVLEEVARRTDLKPTRLQEVLEQQFIPLSLSRSLRETEEIELSDMVKEPGTIIVAQDTRETSKTELDKALKRLTRNERRVIKLRFDWDGNGPKNQREIAAEMGITHQRVSDLEGNALKKLTLWSQGRNLQDFLY